MYGLKNISLKIINIVTKNLEKKKMTQTKQKSLMNRHSETLKSFFLAMVGIEPRASWMLGKHSTAQQSSWSVQ